MRRLIPILGITFVDIIGFSMLIPMLPYFVTHFGASAFVVGLLFATFSLCQLLSAPLWGSVSDRIGRKFVLVTSQIGATIGWTMLAFAPNIGWVFVARIVEGVSGGNIGITQAYVADLVAPKERARAFALIGATFGAGMVFGPVIGGVLFLKHGFAAPFLAAAALQLLTLLLTLVFVPESRRHEDRERVTLRQALALLRDPVLARALAQRLALSLGLYGWYSVIALYLQRQLGFALARTDFFFAAFAAVSVIMNAGAVGGVSRRTGDRRMSNIGLASLLAGFAMLAFVHSVSLLVVSMVLFAFGSALSQNGITALISNAVNDREQGTVLGVGSSLDSLSGIVAPPISTGLLGGAGPSFAGLAPSFFVLAALVMGIVAARREARRTTPV
ncbi:MAG TPA: MFS transporter [Candidatus Dormibacteraeota bacterium]|nr:MFS transporter [Candidatus Dormibacteraeota bacterium]